VVRLIGWLITAEDTEIKIFALHAGRDRDSQRGK